MFYKYIENNIIICIGEAEDVPNECVEISQNEYDHIMRLIQSKPLDTEETIYVLTPEYEYVPMVRPPMPEMPEIRTPYDDGFDEGYEQAILDMLELELEEESEE